MTTEQQVLFSIGQTGIIGEVHQNTGSDSELQIFVSDDNRFMIDLTTHNQGNYQKTNIFGSRNIENHLIFTIIYDIQTNRITNQYYQNITNTSNFNQFKNIINNLQNNQIAILQYKNTGNNFLIHDSWFNYLKNDLNQKCIVNHQYEINTQNYTFFGIVSGKNKKILSEHNQFKSVPDFILNYQYSQIKDLGNSNHGHNLINYDKINFSTQIVENILSEFNLDVNNDYLVFSGLIKKDMNITQGLADAEISIQYLDQNNIKLSEDKATQVQAFTFQDLQLTQRINKTAKKVKIVLYCKNAITVPGELICKNFQCYYSLQDYKYQNKDQSFLTQIGKNGIMTNEYIEQIGFNPRNFDDYTKEYEQKFNLAKNILLPIITEEPIKIFDKIIDNNKLRVVNKVNRNSSNVNIANIQIDNHKSYLVGVWISNKEMNTNTNFQLSCDNILEGLNSRFNKNTPIILDKIVEQKNQNYCFLYQFIYPFGQRNNKTHLKQIIDKFDTSLSEIQSKSKDSQCQRMLIPQNPGTSNISLQISEQNNQNKLNSIYVMPIVKELSITQIQKDRIVQMDLEEVSRRN